MQLLILLLSWLALTTAISATKETVIEIFPKIYVIQNDVSGIHEHDYFSVLTTEYEFVSAFIDDRKLKHYKPKDNAHAQVSRILLSQELQMEEEVFLITYKSPRLLKGQHTLRLSLSKELDDEKRAIPVVQILTDLICQPVPLALLVPSQLEPSCCALNPHSSQMIHRPE